MKCRQKLIDDNVIMQHTVLTPSFVNFLMDNGLREFNQSTKIVRIIFLVFSK